MLRRISAPIVPRRRDAPITATVRGCRKLRTAATAAIRSRSSNRASASGDSEVGSSIAIASGAECMSTGKPLSRNTSIILWLWGRTSAVKVVIPWRSAALARCASMIVAIPWPCHASATRNAVSARSSPVRTYAAWAITTGPLVATSA